jgi:translation initiation factor IF-2
MPRAPWARAQASAILSRAQNGAEQLLAAAGLGEAEISRVADAIVRAAQEATEATRTPAPARPAAARPAPAADAEGGEEEAAPAPQVEDAPPTPMPGPAEPPVSPPAAAEADAEASGAEPDEPSP